MSATFQNYTNITEQGRCVVNAHRDLDEFRNRSNAASNSNIKKLYRDELTDSCRSIIQGELVFANKSSSKVNFKRKLTRISDLCVFSSFNGMFVTGGGYVTDEDRKEKRKTIQFMGVSELTSNHKHGVHNEDEIVVQIGGTRTIVNNGSGPVNVGDIVMWDMPNQDEHNKRPDYPGVSRNKVLPKIKVYKYRRTGPKEDLEEKRSRIIGKALSAAAPGRPFDILLGNHSV